jgi:hypothetical protein
MYGMILNLISYYNPLLLYFNPHNAPLDALPTND